MQSLSRLFGIGSEKLRGPSPTFERAHLVLAFLTIGDGGSVGRQALASMTGLGGGAVRTVLKRLNDQGYVEADASGSHLTQAGKRAYAALRKRVTHQVSIEGSRLTVGNFQSALAVRAGGAAVRGGIEQRDSAIMVGAGGATTYVIKGGRFTIPGGSADCEKDFPGPAWSRLRSEFGPKNGDAVIVCGADDATAARIGALAAAVTLL